MATAKRDEFVVAAGLVGCAPVPVVRAEALDDKDVEQGEPRRSLPVWLGSAACDLNRSTSCLSVRIGRGEAGSEDVFSVEDIAPRSGVGEAGSALAGEVGGEEESNRVEWAADRRERGDRAGDPLVTRDDGR